MSALRRRRLLAATVLGVALAAAVAAVALVLIHPSPGPPPDDRAAALVPGDALAYANVSLDGRLPVVRRALSLAQKLPALRRIAAALELRLEGLAGSGGVPGIADVRPWIGNELSFALVPAPGGVADLLLVAAVARPPEAVGFLRSTGARPDGSAHGAALWRYPDGTEVALAAHDLVAGQPPSVEAAIAAHRAGTSLASIGAYRRSLAAAGPRAVLEAYAPAAGVDELLAGRGGALGALGALLAGPALRAVGVSVAPGDGTLALRLTAELSHPLSAGAYAPTLPGRLPADTPLVLDIGDLPRAAPRILRALADLGIARRVGPLLARLGVALRASGGELPGALRVFDGESAVAVGSVGGGAALLVLARVRDSASARYQLAALIPPLLEVFRTEALQAGFSPSVTQRTLDGAAVQELALEPALGIDYTVIGHLVVISTSIQALRELLARPRARRPIAGLTATGAFRSVFAGRPGQVWSLIYLNVGRLLSEAPATALTRGLNLGSLQAALAHVGAVGITSTSTGRQVITRVVVKVN